MKKSDNKGAAMIMVICVMALVTVLCLSLLLSATVVMSSAINGLSKTQIKTLAVSLSQQLGDEIISKDFQSVSEEQSAKDGSLWYYLKEKMTDKTWPYYNEDEKGHTQKYSYRYFKFDEAHLSAELKRAVGDIDSIKILMYWESYKDAELDNTPLTIKVTCEKNNERCTITSQYILTYTEIISDDGSQMYAKWKWSLDGRQ